MIIRVLTSKEINEYLDSISKQIFGCLFKKLTFDQLATLKVNIGLRYRIDEINERECKQLNKMIASMY